MSPPATCCIRPLGPADEEELELVARRMGETLDEVLGVDRSTDRYSHEWLVNRVWQHLDPEELTGAIFVAQTSGVITGHTIVRLDDDGVGNPIGLFSTIFVAANYRRSGIARALLERGEEWMLDHGVARATTYTHEGNAGLQRLFLRQGYSMSPMPKSSVALSKALVASSSLRPR